MATLRGRRYAFAAWLLSLAGWRVEGDVPDIPKAVLAIAPHTSNWDFVVLVLAKFTLGLQVSFIGKHTLFRGPFGWWLRSMGGMPVDRTQPGNIVDQVVSAMGATDEMYFALAPEGTRRLTSGWKTGFYRIAMQARVPIVLVLIDAGRKQIRISPPVTCTGNVDEDFAALREIAATATGIRATLASPVRPI